MLQGRDPGLWIFCAKYSDNYGFCIGGFFSRYVGSYSFRVAVSPGVQSGRLGGPAQEPLYSGPHPQQRGVTEKAWLASESAHNLEACFVKSLQMLAS